MPEHGHLHKLCEQLLVWLAILQKNLESKAHLECKSHPICFLRGIFHIKKVVTYNQENTVHVQVYMFDC